MAAFLQTMARLGPTRLAALGAVAIGLLAFFVFMTGRLSHEDMAVLYSDLDPADSGKVISKLEGLNVPYEISRDGTRILVPQSRAARLRMAMAEDGLPAGGSLGYEIFDRGSALGTTSFAQRINHLRALEGEIARSIRTLGNVQAARVHLVLPRREIFSREADTPSASIILTLRGPAQLPRQQVLAIQNLVASAVPKLSASRVSIIDDRGNLLARGGEEDAAGSLAAVTAQEMRVSHERRLARTVEELLERSLGFGRVRAEVAVEMDFDRITTNSETFDPDQQVVRSTQTVSDSSQSNDGQRNNGVTVANNLPDAQAANAEGGVPRSERTDRQEETVNYEISKTVKMHVRESGSVRRITAAILVDGSTIPGADGVPTYRPRTAEELEQIAALVRSAIGYDEARGDKVEIVNMPFARPDGVGSDGDAGIGPLGLEKTDMFRIAEIALLGIVGILVLLLVVRPLMARLLESIPGPAAETVEQQMLLPGQTTPLPALAGPAGTGLAVAVGGVAGQDDGGDAFEESMIDVKQVDGRVKASSVNRIGEIIERHPDEAVSILRHWMYQDA
ncbi:MAG: flagellar basal-body MS-ring/collar protein FliF [Alphaproteobacteria bacterium]